jgi:hypothetical protein
MLRSGRDAVMHGGFRHMALRVARGLFRLWLILSVLWVAGVAFVGWKEFVGNYDRDLLTKFRVLAPCLGTGRYEEALTGCSNIPDEFRKNIPTERELAAEVAASKARAEEHGREIIWLASVFAFLPPAFLLALASALMWAFRGFR